MKGKSHYLSPKPVFWSHNEEKAIIREASLTVSRREPMFWRHNEEKATIRKASLTISRRKPVFWRHNEEKAIISEASLIISRRKPVFGRGNEANAIISEANEIDSFVCLTNGREGALYLWNSDSSLMNNKVFYTKRMVRE